MAVSDCFEDLYNLVCGRVIGQGSHRMVFECKIRPDLVVKVESDDNRYFANVFEMQFYCDHKFYDPVKNWLAPCEFMSPDGRVLLQKKCDPIPDNYNLPTKVPEFLTDLKRSNFGFLNGKLVCIDYGMTIINTSLKLKKADWY